MIKAIDANMYLYLFVENIAPIQEILIFLYVLLSGWSMC